MSDIHVPVDSRIVITQTLNNVLQCHYAANSADVEMQDFLLVDSSLTPQHDWDEDVKLTATTGVWDATRSQQPLET